MTPAHWQYDLQRQDKGWFDDDENLIHPLTTQEWENINASSSASSESPIPVSDAHTAIEYYLFADSPDTFYELSSESLAHLYFIKVQAKPPKTIQKLAKKKLVEALMKVVHKPPVFWS